METKMNRFSIAHSQHREPIPTGEDWAIYLSLYELVSLQRLIIYQRLQKWLPSRLSTADFQRCWTLSWLGWWRRQGFLSNASHFAVPWGRAVRLWVISMPLLPGVPWHKFRGTWSDNWFGAECGALNVNGTRFICYRWLYPWHESFVYFTTNCSLVSFWQRLDWETNIY